jgi:hypothetical protein
MMNFSPSGFSSLVALVMIGITTPQMHAGASNKSGNPFGNGTQFSTAGTFSGVLRGVNLVGVTQFSTSTTNTLTGGPLYVYYNDWGLFDDTLGVYATLNPSANNLSAVILPSPTNSISVTNTAIPAPNNMSEGGGAFSASLTTTPPNQTFSGSGQLSTVTNSLGNGTNGVSTNMPFSISGCRISSQ